MSEPMPHADDMRAGALARRLEQVQVRVILDARTIADLIAVLREARSELRRYAQSDECTMDVFNRVDEALKKALA